MATHTLAGERVPVLFREALTMSHQVGDPAAVARGLEGLAYAAKERGHDQFDREWANGYTLSAADAVAYAERCQAARPRPATGWASLTPAEYDVARCAAEGLTDRQIGERLFVSPPHGRSA